MIVELEKRSVCGEIKAIPSKSYAHRIAICNFLAGQEKLVDCGEFTSKDIQVTVDCLTRIRQGKTLLDAGESGSTLRFLLPLTCALGGSFEFIGHGKLIERPNAELFGVLTAHGVTVSQDKTIKLSGRLTHGEYRLRGDISSQYVSGLLMALPTLDGDSTITLTTPLVSAPYVEITLEVLRAFGIEIKKTENGYFIKGGQKFKGGALPEGDWSNMAFFLVLGAFSGQIKVTGLNLDSVQGDKKIIEVLKSAGAQMEFDGGITVKKSSLNAFTLDAEDCPDLVPIVCVLASFAKGKSVIKNVERLKIKESDRIDSTLCMLRAFGISAQSDGHSITVEGACAVGAKVDSFNDHRIVMSASVLATGASGKSVITDAGAVAKSYPSFFEDFKSVGGKVSEI